MRPTGHATRTVLGEGTAPQQADQPPSESALIDHDEPAQSAIPLVVVAGFLALAGAMTAFAVRKRRV